MKKPIDAKTPKRAPKDAEFMELVAPLEQRQLHKDDEGSLRSPKYYDLYELEQSKD